MLTMFNQTWTNCSGQYWMDFFDKHKSVRAKFAKNEVAALVSENEAMCYSDVDWEEGSKHLGDPAIDKHIKDIGETTSAYELVDQSECPDGHALWFGHFTFENESPEEWIAVWKNDTKRATTNEKFAIVDSNNVLVLAECAVTNEQFAAHVARPDVKAHIERTRETGKLWGAFPK